MNCKKQKIAEKPEHIIFIDNYVMVSIIDKETGKIVTEKRESKNVTLGRGAEAFIYAICGVPYTTPWNKVNIYTTTKSYIKTISGTFGTMGDYAGYKYIQLTAEDTSTDEYTCRYFGNHKDSQTTYTENFFAYDYGSPVTKASNQTLRVVWEFRVGYSSPP